MWVNLLDTGKEKQVYEKVRAILLKYGAIHDEAMKFYGMKRAFKPFTPLLMIKASSLKLDFCCTRQCK
ncbi:MAG TPA: hypothetical protein DEQ06_00530 [Porphyromonadaceae bacterium]|nr:hypothetical protein [Porphyromonadaceae bacterium]